MKSAGRVLLLQVAAAGWCHPRSCDAGQVWLGRLSPMGECPSQPRRKRAQKGHSWRLRAFLAVSGCEHERENKFLKKPASATKLLPYAGRKSTSPMPRSHLHPPFPPHSLLFGFGRSAHVRYFGPSSSIVGIGLNN
eukprot:scaffold254447_cov28-Tisochrysis_lutea.AAC.1